MMFHADGCDIIGRIPNEIGNLSGLISVQLADNGLTGDIPVTIGGLKELQSLSLTDNTLEGSIPSELCRLDKLALLFLTSNTLSGPIPTCLGNVVSLRNLFLGSNMFSSSIPSALTGLKDLLILNLSSNSLTGSLPIDIGKWKVLISMDLSNNQFSSDIPTGVVNLKDLTHFSLSNNRITGLIPQSLDLKEKFQLEKLRYLIYFNVSFNRLEGKIPGGGAFGNYSIESFKGNKGLCGAPQLHVRSCQRNSKARIKLVIYVTLPIASTLLVVALIIIILRSRKRKDNLPTQEDLLPLGTWKRISYHELHQATDGFSQNKLLGNGSYGSVYHGTLSDGITFAVKVFNLELQGAFKSFDVECEVLRNTRHRNLIKIISSRSNDLDFKALVLEFMPNGSFDKWLYYDNHILDILQRLNIMIDIASALEYLHHGNATPIVHSDLKPSNVLLDEDMVAHLSDFGIAKLLCNEDSMIQTITMATIGYMAPEYGIDGIVSTKGDVYSFGILLMETVTRKKPIDEMFTGERSLKSWVKESISTPLNQVVDMNLLSTNGREHSAANDCALSILQVALECSAELPDERHNMKEIVTKLKKIKAKFLKNTERARQRLT
ncbi:putative Leucine-rich repeat protein kinase family protein [Hibiscus syriacus]|uniref:non-specific serine/threonine protein kinase n=1 Tax=Hibiscus syriacus TaxID=106335 RepID=A0A6A3AHQ5_HIBSY|nr:putative Leucine-rich repeat protein kinase family protein [Hibiscus syriacus]